MDELDIQELLEAIRILHVEDSSIVADLVQEVAEHETA
jgi:hypothetical protein